MSYYSCVYVSHVQGCAKLMALFSRLFFSKMFMWENLLCHHIFSAGVELDSGIEINVFEAFVALAVLQAAVHTVTVLS